MHVLAFLLFSRLGVSAAPLGLLWRIILFQDLMFVGCTLFSAVGMVAIYIYIFIVRVSQKIYIHLYLALLYRIVP